MTIRLTHDEALDLVYREIARLRTSGGKKLTVTEVADLADVARSTMNSKVDPDWIEVRNVIFNNTTNQRLKLALSEFKEQSKWQVEASRFESELTSCQDILNELTLRVDSDFGKILGQLHKYMHSAGLVPSKMNNDTKRLQENQEFRRKNEFLEAENRNLKARYFPNNPLLPFIRKSVINVYPEDQRGNLQNLQLDDLTMNAKYALDEYFEGDFPPEVVYILCGNFASGKSTWISEHKPPFKESTSALYIDGTCHLKRLRKDTVNYVRHLSNKHKVNCKIICVRTLYNLEQCLSWNNDPNRIRTKAKISEELIKTMAKGFQQEEVVFDEGFNEIILVGGHNG